MSEKPGGVAAGGAAATPHCSKDDVDLRGLVIEDPLVGWMFASCQVRSITMIDDVLPLASFAMQCCTPMAFG